MLTRIEVSQLAQELCRRFNIQQSKLPDVSHTIIAFLTAQTDVSVGRQPVDENHKSLMIIGAMASVMAVPSAMPMGFDFGFPRPRKGNKYAPPSQKCPDYSTMTRQQRRAIERKKCPK